jgi:hypothetical protein
MLAVLLFSFVFLAGCEQKVEDVHYRQGYSDGYVKGKAAGYSEGYQTAYPGTNHRYSSVVGGAHKLFAFLGAFKIVVSLVIFIVFLFERSKSSEEVAGKILFGAVGSVLAFFTLPLLGVQGTLNSALLAPSPSNSLKLWVLTIFAGVITFALGNVAEKIFRAINGVWIEVWGIFTATALVTVLVHGLVNLFWYSSDVNDYLGSDILVGVFMGGLLYIATRLVQEAIQKRVHADKNK